MLNEKPILQSQAWKGNLPRNEISMRLFGSELLAAIRKVCAKYVRLIRFEILLSVVKRMCRSFHLEVPVKLGRAKA
jgi:hypothetical protein